MWQECLACGDTITNQICYRCTEAETEKWLSTRSPSYVKSLKRVGEFFASYFHEGADCITCGENLNICGKCYCLSVYKAFKKRGTLASEFLEFAANKGFTLATEKGVLNLTR